MSSCSSDVETRPLILRNRCQNQITFMHIESGVIYESFCVLMKSVCFFHVPYNRTRNGWPLLDFGQRNTTVLNFKICDYLWGDASHVVSFESSLPLLYCATVFQSINVIVCLFVATKTRWLQR